jgi:hypothetical protein
MAALPDSSRVRGHKRWLPVVHIDIIRQTRYCTTPNFLKTWAPGRSHDILETPVTNYHSRQKT